MPYSTTMQCSFLATVVEVNIIFQPWQSMLKLGQQFHVLSRSSAALKLSRSDADWITWDAKYMEAQWRMLPECSFSWATPSFVMIFVGFQCIKNHTPYFVCAFVCNNRCLSFFYILTACSEPHPLIFCCCSTSRVLPLQFSREYYSSIYVQLTYSLHEANSTFVSHVWTKCLWVATSTNPSK